MISVIIPAYRAPTLQKCLSRVLDQRVDEDFEVIVCVSADRPGDLPQLLEDPRLRVLEHVPRLPAAAARNRAAAESRGRVLVFTDADVLVGPGWLASFEAASRGGDCVAGAVFNGTPESGAGTAEYLVEFLDFHPHRKAATLWHGATCNLLVPLELWQQLGPFPEDLRGGEDTIFTVAAKSIGRLKFEPECAVVHMNRCRWAAVIAHQVAFGRFSAHVARRSPYRGRALVSISPLAPLAFIARVASLYGRLASWDRRLLRRALRLAPGVLVLLAAWAGGLAIEGAKLDGARALRALRRGVGD